MVDDLGGQVAVLDFHGWGLLWCTSEVEPGNGPCSAGGSGSVLLRLKYTRLLFLIPPGMTKDPRIKLDGKSTRTRMAIGGVVRILVATTSPLTIAWI
eukprot:scaffold155997_cov41-Prasinocladus_malaysianus.AAC.1